MLPRLALLLSQLFILLSCSSTEKPSEQKPPKQYEYLKQNLLRITEVHYKPSPEQGKVEFIEVSNVGRGEGVNVTGWYVSGAGKVLLPPRTLAPGQSIVLVQSRKEFARVFGDAVQPGGKLRKNIKNSADTIRLRDPHGRVADEVGYDSSSPRIRQALATGNSLHRVKISGDSIWRAGKPSPGSFRSSER